MNHTAREKRIGLLSVVAALVMIAVWWLLLMPAVSKYKVHRQEARLKEKLGSIKPLGGVKPGDIRITRVPKLDSVFATRFDGGGLDCIGGGMYYRNEFANAGFSYTGEKVDPKEHTTTLSFAGQDYGADVQCVQLSYGLHIVVQADHVYAINMWPLR